MDIIRKLVVLLLILLCIQFPAIAAEEGSIPASWGITFQTDDVISAARQACLIYDGIGHWEDAVFQTVGLHIFNQKETDDTITLQLYTSHRVYKIVDGKAEQVAGGHHPVLISFTRSGDTLVLTQYRIAGDGTQYWKNINAMFGEALAYDVSKNRDKYAELAERDALQIAEQYLSANESEKLSLPCLIFLTSGTNTEAESIIHKNISGWFPSYIGKYVSYINNTMYRLSIEGEQSFSGILTYESFNPRGERLTYVKVQVDGNKLNVLDGKLPSMYD